MPLTTSTLGTQDLNESNAIYFYNLLHIFFDYFYFWSLLYCIDKIHTDLDLVNC